MPGLTTVAVEGLTLEVRLTHGPRLQLCAASAWDIARAPLLDLSLVEAQALVALLQRAIQRVTDPQAT